MGIITVCEEECVYTHKHTHMYLHVYVGGGICLVHVQGEEFTFHFLMHFIFFGSASVIVCNKEFFTNA